MAIDRNSPVHLYIQIADNIRGWIASGAYAPGSVLPTEEELCKQFGVSRFPMRQAMAMLMEERLICRARGKGTFVAGGEKKTGIPPVQSASSAYSKAAAHPRACALVLPGMGSGLTADILRGFERAAFERGYATLIALAGGSVSEEAAVEHVVGNGACGVVIFPKNNTLLTEGMLSGWLNRGVYISLIDRNPGLEHFDYVGSDNFGGGYMAAHHMSLNGYKAALFVAEQYAVSSVKERCAGFNRGLQRFEMQALSAECGGSGDGYVEFGDFISNLNSLRARVPFGVFAENDELAEKVMLALAENGFSVGDEAGVIGFDDSTLCQYLTPRLTSVAQNGYLIGETAARLAIEKTESGSRQSVRHILPTQLAARRSCGEGRPEQV